MNEKLWKSSVLSSLQLYLAAWNLSIRKKYNAKNDYIVKINIDIVVVVVNVVTLKRKKQ